MASTADAQRSCVTSPDVYKVIAENNNTRVIPATWKPGQRDEWHSHPLGTAVSSSIRTRAAVLCAAVAAVFVSLGALSSAVAEDQDAARPTLSDLMVLTQLRHYKLWYSERLENWKLADYELNQLVTTVDRIAKLYPEARSVAQANLIREKTDPALSELRTAIRDKSNLRFEAAFNQVTDACNQCHQAAGVDFILVRLPTKSPFSNQMFTPNPGSKNRP